MVLRRRSGIKVLVFGTGDYYQRYKKWVENLNVQALLDNSADKQGTLIDGHPVVSPNDINKFEYDNIIILSFQYKAMKKQLLELGVNEDRIYHFYTLRKLIHWQDYKKEIQHYSLSKPNEDSLSVRILLMTPELTVGGPSLALLHMGHVLINHGYNVSIVSMIDGELKESYLKENIDVIIDNNLQLSVMSEEKWINEYDLIICNTLNFHVFLSERNNNIPCIWWLHDAEFFYDGADINTFRKIQTDNMIISSVGRIPCNAIKKMLPDINVNDLLYGVEETDFSETALDNKDDALTFITIGFLEEIKGQDILLEAIKKIYHHIKKVRFLIVGYDNTLFGQRLKYECRDIPEIVFTGVADRYQLHKYLSGSSALICPSRQDSMPTVVAEAMMYSKPCIISDIIGTAQYLKDGRDCLIFKSEDAEELGQKIVWCMEHTSELNGMGLKARKIFEQKFSMTVFENNVLDLMKYFMG